jgi:hypothetical protein
MFVHDDSNDRHNCRKVPLLLTSQLTRGHDDVPFDATLALWKHSYLELQIMVVHRLIIDALH